MNLFIATSLILSVTLSLCSYGQVSTAIIENSLGTRSTALEKETEPSISRDISTSVSCVIDVLASPHHWDGSDAIMAGGVMLGLGGSFLLDDEMRSLAVRNQSSFNENVLVQIGNPYSTVLYVAPATVLLYFSGVAFENQWMRESGQMLGEALATIAIVQIPLSITIGRARPFFNEGNTSFKAFAGLDDDRASFFSGHSMVAFSLSTILSRQIDNPWVSVGLYSLAALGPWSRLYKDKHWFSDTFLGSALGVFVGNSIWKWHNEEDRSHLGVRIIPTGRGLSLVWVF
ncbi:MAG TPA: phosphatase PAP2 family protein [Bacteroidota bacterium]